MHGDTGIMSPMLSSSMANPLEEGAGEGQPEDPEGSTVKEGTSTVNLSAENNDPMTNSGKADAQDGQTAHSRMLISHEGKRADTTVDPVKPSEPSVSDVGKPNDKNQNANSSAKLGISETINRDQSTSCNQKQLPSLQNPSDALQQEQTESTKEFKCFYCNQLFK